MLIRALAALILACVCAAPALAGPCALTHEQARLVGEAVAQNEPAAHYSEIDGERAQKLIAVINATPPVSDVALDRILVIVRTDTGKATIAYVRDECVFHSGIIPIAEFEGLEAKAFGSEAKPQ